LIPYGHQDIKQKDIDAVVNVLGSDFLTQGPKVPQFEQAVADYCGARHAVAVNSGTSALHIACLALGLGSGDILWTSPISFVASANCGLYCGAKVDFVDIELRTCNLCPKALEKKLQIAQRVGQLPKIVVPVHFSGQPCDMETIYTLSQKFDFRIIEDASHALGARYQNDPVGNCKYSDITVFSFHPVKIITTGEGGIAATNDDHLAERMKRLRTHGITTGGRDQRPEVREDYSDFPPPAWYYEQIDLGYNYRMTEIQAALGISQIQRLNAFVTRRRELARRYDEVLTDMPVATLGQNPEGSSAWHLYVVRLKLDNIRFTHRQVFDCMRKSGIGVNLHYIPIHLQPYYRNLGFKPGMFPEAEKYYLEAITLPLFPGMTKEQQDIVIHVLRKALDG
jgi:UDP-4-amino-4,6-dideoxy-N-acetyl-beta-L-altrosamine transaminase